MGRMQSYDVQTVCTIKALVGGNEAVITIVPEGNHNLGAVTIANEGANEVCIKANVTNIAAKANAIAQAGGLSATSANAKFKTGRVSVYLCRRWLVV